MGQNTAILDIGSSKIICCYAALTAGKGSWCGGQAYGNTMVIETGGF